jgi:hypothetical protein
MATVFFREKKKTNRSTRKTLFKRLSFHVIMEGEKFHNLSFATWKLKVSGIDQRSENHRANDVDPSWNLQA